MPIPDALIDQIRERTDIVEVISRYVTLVKAGRNYKAPCPFHHEKSPSFMVSPDKQIYHCFGCNAGGNVFSFLMKYENLPFPEVVEMLAEKAGVALPADSRRSGEDASLANQLYAVNDAACQYFQTALANNAFVKEYLASRGVASETAVRLRIGFAPDGWEGLLTFFKKRGVAPELVERAGLAIPNDRGGRYDRFRNRVIFPIMDIKDRILGFGARVLDASLPKYINSPETPIYSKGRHLYGLNFSREDIRRERTALIVEGYLDFIIPFQAGVRHIIATLGTALTIDQVRLLKRFADTVIMVYDPDAAGEAASLRNLDLFISEDVNVYIAELPEGNDPDGFIRKFGADDFLALVKASKNLFAYKLDKLLAKYDATSVYGKSGIVAEMLPTIARINNAVVRDDLKKRLAERLGVDEESIKEEFRKVKQPAPYGEARQAPAAVKRPETRRDWRSAEMVILALLFENTGFIDRAAGRITAGEFRDTSVRDIVTSVFELHRQGVPVSPSKLISHLGNNADAAVLISEAVNILDTLADKEKALEDCIGRIKKDNMRDMLARLQDAIRAAHNVKDEERVRQLVLEYNNLVKANRV